MIWIHFICGNFIVFLAEY